MREDDEISSAKRSVRQRSLIHPESYVYPTRPTGEASTSTQLFPGTAYPLERDVHWSWLSTYMEMLIRFEGVPRYFEFGYPMFQAMFVVYVSATTRQIDHLQQRTL